MIVVRNDHDEVVGKFEVDELMLEGELKSFRKFYDVLNSVDDIEDYEEVEDDLYGIIDELPTYNELYSRSVRELMRYYNSVYDEVK